MSLVAVVSAVLWATGAASLVERIRLCSGYGCYYSKTLRLDAADMDHLTVLLAQGAASPAAERAAISRAVRYFENRASEVIGVRDGPRGVFGKARVYGQMDCIDESRNTRALLNLLQKRRLLRHHTVARNASRGLFMDRRYPHSTAVVRDGAGVLWAVDSWYEPAGGAPDIMQLSRWRKRGVMGKR